jgi:hypothetical protein
MRPPQKNICAVQRREAPDLRLKLKSTAQNTRKRKRME